MLLNALLLFTNSMSRKSKVDCKVLTLHCCDVGVALYSETTEKSNGAFTTLHLSKEVIKQFVQPYTGKALYADERSTVIQHSILKISWETHRYTHTEYMY